MTTREVLLAAAREIEERGWWDGTDDFPEPGGPCCFVMSIMATRASNDEQSEAENALRRYLGCEYLVDWPHNRTQAEAIAALREAAARCA